MCRNSVSKILSASPADMRFERVLHQQRSIIYHNVAGISWWSTRNGLFPVTIEYIAAISVISENGGCPVRTCVE